MSESKKHTRFRILKIMGWTVLFITLLVTTLRFSLKWDWVHNIAKNQVESIANESLNGKLTIGDISGDLWKDFTLSGIHLIQSDTTLSLRSTTIQYNVWGLLNSTFDATSIDLSGLKLNIRETTTDQFNILEAVETDTSENESSSSFGFMVETLNVKDASIFISSPTYLPDSTLTVDQLNASAGFILSDETSASLSSLSFKVLEGRLPDPIAIQTSASYENELISLNNLVLETGRSLLRAKGFTNLQDSTLSTEAEALPFSIKDLKPYFDTGLPDDEITISLEAGGTLDSLNIRVQAEGEGFDDLLLISDLSLAGSPSLHKFGVTGTNLDISYFTQDSVDAFIRDFSLTAEGALNQELSEAELTWGFTLSEISYEDYRFEILFGSGTLENEKLLANFQLSNGQDQIIVNPEIDSLWSERPSWNVVANVSDINLGWWLNDPGLESNISFRSHIQGKGFQLSKQPWTYSVKPTDTIDGHTVDRDTVSNRPRFNPSFVTDTVTIAGQSFSNFGIQGNISQDSVSTDGSIQLLESKINISAAITDFLSEVPEYRYHLHSREFNLNEIVLIDDLSSSLNMNIRGTGSHFDPNEIQLETNVLIDSSYVNGAAFDLLGIDAYLDNNILRIQKGELVSEIIAGSFNGQRNLQDRTDPDNNFELNMELKNLQPLAPLAGSEILRAKGTITGNVTEAEENMLIFDGDIGLNEIRYDSLFTAETIEGRTKISIRDVLDYDFSLNVTQPTFSNISLQDLEFSSIGTSSSDSLTGTFNFDILSDDAGEIIQSGSYDIGLEDLNAIFTWNEIRFQMPESVLSLEEPFTVSYRDAAITTDTLSVRAKDGAYFTLSIPYADSDSQRAWARVSDFDFGQIQEIALGEQFINGMLSGNAAIYNSRDSLAGNAAVKIADLKYMDTEMELFDLNFEIENKRLRSQLSVFMNGEEKVGGFLNVPFVAESPEALDESFFAESVSGELYINPVQLREFENLLTALEITETNGILSFKGALSGTAGQPNIDGDFKLNEPVLSGIAIDSALASFDYHHNDGMITGLSEVFARGQKAASINAEIPISMDFRSLEMKMPEEEDSLSLNLLTNNFNLSVFNDFLDKQYANRLKGTLNANVQISGTIDDLNSQGFLRLEGGELGVPIAGISLTSITSEMQLSESGIALNQLNMRSGSGSFTANGSIGLDGIVPSQLNINAKATRFRLANTADYNLTIDLDSKLTGNPMRPKASGILTVKSGFVYLQDFGEKSVEIVELEGEDASSFSPYDSLAMDMQFVIERNFQVRNSRYLDLEIDLSGELDAQKQTAGELQLFGTLNGNRGYVSPLGKRFNLEEGRFTFSGPVTEPNLYINTSYVPQSAQKEGDPIILYYIIEGNALEPEFRFESDPPMEQQDIICYTLFNKPCYALESWQQVVSGGSGSSPTDLLVGVLLDEVESLATQELGIDVVQIETNRSGTDTGTSIKTGWYLNRKTFFAIVNEISGTTPKTMFILEYMLRENLDLIITQGDDNRQGVDLRWQYDY